LFCPKARVLAEGCVKLHYFVSFVSRNITEKCAYIPQVKWIILTHTHTDYSSAIVAVEFDGSLRTVFKVIAKNI